MAIDPVTAKTMAKIIISQITDEEKRQRLIIGIVVGVIMLILLIMLPLFIITEPIDNIRIFFTFDNDEIIVDEDYRTILEMKDIYGYNLDSGELNFNGSLPMPLESSFVVTSEYGMRVHPVTGAYKLHSGIDLAGKWRGNVLSVLDGKVIFAGVQTGYGNCIEIEHNLEGEIFYTFYAHLARIDVIKGQTVMQGNIIGLQGGDPKKDPNPRIFNRYTSAF